MNSAVLPDYQHHMNQRGHNRQLVFAETRDFESEVAFAKRYNAANSPLLSVSWRRSKRSLAIAMKIGLAADLRKRYMSHGICE